MVYSNRKATEQYDLSDDERTSPLDPYLPPQPLDQLILLISCHSDSIQTSESRFLFLA